MIAIKIIDKDIKAVMTKLLLRDAFDTFLLEKAQILTSAELVLSGRRNRNWYNSDRWSELEQQFSKDCHFMRWEEVKTIIFNYIKGSQTPDLMKIFFKASRSQTEEWLADSGALHTCHRLGAELFLQIRYEQGELQITTGISFPQFQMDRMVERAWDEAVLQFFRREQVGFE